MTALFLIVIANVITADRPVGFAPLAIGLALDHDLPRRNSDQQCVRQSRAFDNNRNFRWRHNALLLMAILGGADRWWVIRGLNCALAANSSRWRVEGSATTPVNGYELVPRPRSCANFNCRVRQCLRIAHRKGQKLSLTVETAVFKLHNPTSANAQCWITPSCATISPHTKALKAAMPLVKTLVETELQSRVADKELRRRVSAALMHDCENGNVRPFSKKADT